MTKRERTKIQAMFDKKTRFGNPNFTKIRMWIEGLKKGNSSCSTSGTRHVTIAKIQRYAMKENKTNTIV